MLTLKFRTQTLLLAIFAFGISPILSGCGGGNDNRASISGSVTFNGEPVEEGSITFIAEKGPSTGGAISNGTYSIPSENGPMLGNNTVHISWNKKTGKQIEAGSPTPAGTKIDERKEAIPDKYNKKSELKVDIKSGANKEDFTLTK
ncbi:hypothetical protein SH668x_001637 [Planctomicrobium sp. SH668]|uniref:hypothetical protein n=1 Tax=Planctomicrobium sp. SH668 TaxID=3448126 RepID=UPI003F5C2ED9